MESIQLSDVEIELTWKPIKNLHLSVHPPAGTVRVSAPRTMPRDVVRAFLIGKLPWIRKQREKILAQERESPREYLEGESHYFQGQRLLLEIHPASGPYRVEVNHQALQLYLHPSAGIEARRRLLERFYREHLKGEVPNYIKGYEKRLGVEVAEFGIKKMKTRWGTCNPRARRIWINLELAKKPPECLEYLVLHEMLHLIEPRHNRRFKTLMERHYPRWRSVRDQLNRLPIRREEWGY